MEVFKDHKKYKIVKIRLMEDMQDQKYYQNIYKEKK